MQTFLRHNTIRYLISKLIFSAVELPNYLNKMTILGENNILEYVTSFTNLCTISLLQKSVKTRGI